MSENIDKLQRLVWLGTAIKIALDDGKQTLLLDKSDMQTVADSVSFAETEMNRLKKVGRKKKFANDAERYAFHNAKRKKKAE